MSRLIVTFVTLAMVEGGRRPGKIARVAFELRFCGRSPIQRWTNIVNSDYDTERRGPVKGGKGSIRPRFRGTQTEVMAAMARVALNGRCGGSPSGQDRVPKSAPTFHHPSMRQRSINTSGATGTSILGTVGGSLPSVARTSPARGCGRRAQEMMDGHPLVDGWRARWCGLRHRGCRISLPPVAMG